LAFEQIFHESETFSNMIYDTFFSDIDLSPSDLEDNKVKLNDVRKLYGNKFTNDLTHPDRDYLANGITQSDYDDFLDTLIYIHDEFVNWNNIAREGDEDAYHYVNECKIVDVVKQAIANRSYFNP